VARPPLPPFFRRLTSYYLVPELINRQILHVSEFSKINASDQISNMIFVLLPNLTAILYPLIREVSRNNCLFPVGICGRCRASVKQDYRKQCCEAIRFLLKACYIPYYGQKRCFGCLVLIFQLYPELNAKALVKIIRITTGIC
jgi:hypothetical protein